MHIFGISNKVFFSSIHKIVLMLAKLQEKGIKYLKTYNQPHIPENKKYSKA